MNQTQLAHFANVRDVLHIAGHDVPRADFQVYRGESPVFQIDGKTYKTYAGFMRAANRIAWTLF
jgi:hypothetical protein